jgi:cell division protein FtsB
MRNRQSQAILGTNAVRALAWFKLATAQGNDLATRNSEIEAEIMTHSQIVDAGRLARERLEAHQ